jgi:hypothetical protein
MYIICGSCLNQDSEVVLHRSVKTIPNACFQAIAPYRDDLAFKPPNCIKTVTVSERFVQLYPRELSIEWSAPRRNILQNPKNQSIIALCW